jgi:lipoprotein-releasing system permease protein
MNGFEKDLEGNILGLMPQALITSTGWIDQPPADPSSSKYKALKGVSRVAPRDHR